MSIRDESNQNPNPFLEVHLPHCWKRFEHQEVSLIMGLNHRDRVSQENRPKSESISTPPPRSNANLLAEINGADVRERREI